MRIVSLAPMTRPDDLVPPIAKPAPTPAAARDRFMNWRRLRCDFDPSSQVKDVPSVFGETLRDYDRWRRQVS